VFQWTACLPTMLGLAWTPGGDARSVRAIASTGHEIVVSAASAWEIATKYRIGRLD
jgi:PIN domain nuclease of toxin-antitoxin system